MTTVFHARPYGRFIEIKSNFARKKPRRTNQGYHFLDGSFRNGDIVIAPMQFRRERQSSEEKDRSSEDKTWKILSLEQIHPFHINSTKVIIPVKRNKLSFLPPLNSTSLFLPQPTVSRRSEPTSEDNSSCCQKIRCLITLRVESSIIIIDSNITNRKGIELY